MDGALNTIVNEYMPPLGEVRSRANDGHSSGTNPDHGSDNRIHEIVGSAFRGGAIYIQRNFDMQSVTFEPTKIVSERCYEEVRVGWLVGSYEEGQGWPDPLLNIVKALPAGIGLWKIVWRKPHRGPSGERALNTYNPN